MRRPLGRLYSVTPSTLWSFLGKAGPSAAGAGRTARKATSTTRALGLIRVTVGSPSGATMDRPERPGLSLRYAASASAVQPYPAVAGLSRCAAGRRRGDPGLARRRAA